MDLSGTFAVFDERGYGDITHTHGTSIWIANLETGKFDRLVTAEGGDNAWTPTISGHMVAWSEIHYVDDPITLAGRQSWRIKVMNLQTRVVKTIATGTNARLEGGAAPWVQFDIDGNTLVYAEQASDTPGSLSYRIILKAIDSGSELRSFTTDRSLYDLALSDETILYSEGLVDPAASFKYDTRLLVSTAAAPAPQVVATDPFEVAVSGDRLAWVNDWVATQLHSGLAVRPQIYTQTLDSPASLAKVSALPDGNPVQGVAWPSVADGVVSWVETRLTNADQPTILASWNSTMAATREIAQTGGAILDSAGGGWLA